ncbi:hypothetical protein [Ralstonia pseudosolanacearum]|uniref:hypothetical protein n=1 Tax=Ralstonia pseudosolanacearum TaxID=1310165 RepID=UPI003AAC2424
MSKNVLSMPSSRSLNEVRFPAELRFEDAFHLLLGRMVHAIARLDFHVGLELRYWGSDKDTNIQSLLKPKTAKLDERLKALECLMRAAWVNTAAGGQREFSLWFERAHRARVFRNDYAHGRWGVPGKHLPGESGRFCDATPLLVFVPLNWDMSPSREDESIAMTLDEFAAQVGEAEQLSGQFQDLATKYGEHLHVGKRLSRSGE